MIYISRIILFILLFPTVAMCGLKVGTGAGCSFSGPTVAVGAAQIINVWLFAGQSNTAAADSLVDPTGGGITDMIGMDLQTTADQAALLYCYAHGVGVKYDWGDIRGYPGTSFGEDADGGANPYIVAGGEVTFNRDLYTASATQKQAFIKFYGNYTSLESGHSAWYPGNSKYTGLTAFIDARLNDLRGMGYDPQIQGIIYHQGIDDGILHRSQADYSADITALFGGLRTAYGVGIPIVIIRSVNSPIAGTTYMAPIRDAQVEVAGTISNAAWVSNDDLENVNYHHLSFAAHITLGGRVYDAMNGLTPP